MSRSLARLLLVLVLVVLAGAAAPGSAAAAPGSTAAAKDGRTLVNSSRLNARPYRGMVLVAVGERVVCTGFVVAPRKVVTAAHCLARDPTAGNYRLRKDVPGVLRLYRAYSEGAGGSRYASCTVSGVWAHPRFIRRNARDKAYGSHAHDYAVLTVPNTCVYPQNAIMRMWSTEASDGQIRPGSNVKLGGYPADPRFNGMTGLNLWRTDGEVKPLGDDSRLLDTSGFVAQGMSGGPVWRTFDSDSPCGRPQCVVAILTECAVNGRGLCKLGDSTRRAIRITPLVKRSIRRH